MGAWGVGTFDNDTACDWVSKLDEVHDLSVIENALTEVEQIGTQDLDGDVAREALAACDVIARLKGKSGQQNAYTETVDNWVTAHPISPTAQLLRRALFVIDRVISSPSELLDLWLDDSTKREWLAEVADLRTRIAS